MSATDTILEIHNLDLTYPIRLFHAPTARDVFVNALSSPWLFFSKRHRRHILKDISFNVHRGERLALVGANGSGKTTLCRCIAGVLNPTRGCVLRKAPVRAVIQTDSGFLQELSGRENAHLLSHFLYNDLSPQERHEIVEEAVSFSDLGTYADAPLETYSLGMKSRLSLSITTARPQEVLILDEVYNNADEFFQKKIHSRILRQIENSGAVIMVSHYERDIADLCTRALVLHEGSVKYDGTVQTALRAYRFINGEIGEVHG